MDFFTKVNSQTNTRDKLARLLQYTSRLLWHQFENRNVDKYSIDRIKNLENSLSSFRKILRFGKCVDMLYSALDCSRIEDPWVRTTLTFSKISQALYLYADHILWLLRSGFLQTDKNWAKTANKFWLTSIIFNLLRDLYEILNILDSKQTFLRKSPLLSSGCNFDVLSTIRHSLFIINCNQDVFIDTLKNSCDIFIPLTALGFTKLSPSAVGTLGAISSFAALVTIFKPITKLVPS